MAETRAIWAMGNEYLAEAAPWTAIKTDAEAAALSVRTALNLVVMSAIIAQPVIPHAAAKVLDALGVPEENRNWPDAEDAGLLDALPIGLKFTPPDVLFTKITDDEVTEWGGRFGAES